MKKTENNFLFIGEAGSGKSEIAINYAKQLRACSDKPVHFFDMDMTKPLFRSRDLQEDLQKEGIELHFEEQFMDAPTLVGGVKRLLKDQSCYVVMDVGGDDIGARSIGGFAPMLNMENTKVYYVINPYRPWSYDIEHIDQVLGAILGVSHIQMEKLHLVSNPNIGSSTKKTEIIEGHKKLDKILAPYMAIDFACVTEKWYDEVKDEISVPVMPLRLHLQYPWDLSCECG